MICDLTAMPIVNASFLDEGIVVVEAMNMFFHIKNKKGSINIALYKSDTDFKQEKFSYVNRISADSDGVIVFNRIDYGNYGVAVYHDENENFKLDRNFVGMPAEGYGFSNNVKGQFGPPGFKDTSVSMNQSETNLSIQLNY